jgi:hypothetical protein
MNILKHIILIPVYNDWKSLNKLLFEISQNFKDDNFFSTEILIINDNSSEKINIDNKNFTNLKKIEVINLKKNLGSQKSIAVGLNHLKNLNNNFFITVMDGDGEDNPHQLKNMLEEAKLNENYIITSNRKKREEPLVIIFAYKIHLIISFLFSFKWISFGNFTTFNSKNLSKLLSNNNSWYAHSSSVLYNCKIKRLYAKREKRYFDKSKLNFLSLIEHSLRVNAVFLKRIFIISIIYSILILIFAPSNLFLYLIFFITLFNILLIYVRRKHHIKDIADSIELIEGIESF